MNETNGKIRILMIEMEGSDAAIQDVVRRVGDLIAQHNPSPELPAPVQPPALVTTAPEPVAEVDSDPAIPEQAFSGGTGVSPVSPIGADQCRSVGSSTPRTTGVSPVSPISADQCRSVGSSVVTSSRKRRMNHQVEIIDTGQILSLPEACTLLRGAAPQSIRYACSPSGQLKGGRVAGQRIRWAEGSDSPAPSSHSEAPTPRTAWRPPSAEPIIGDAVPRHSNGTSMPLNPHRVGG